MQIFCLPISLHQALFIFVSSPNMNNLRLILLLHPALLELCLDLDPDGSDNFFREWRSSTDGYITQSVQFDGLSSWRIAFIVLCHSHQIGMVFLYNMRLIYYSIFRTFELLWQTECWLHIVVILPLHNLCWYPDKNWINYHSNRLTER